ncbi:hypothetical protein WJX74_000679 [Apatococcus lobatus]|uniref:Fungal lipase-type domain-containing protein n=1 Tax=Apatococcus lobatus TaxID=904363 RepID=A0AAW1RGQ8_9CHLO
MLQLRRSTSWQTLREPLDIRPKLRSWLFAENSRPDLFLAQQPRIPRTPLQGASDWAEYIPAQEQQQEKPSKPNPRQIHQKLRQTLLKYAELTQVCYDSFYGNDDDPKSFGCNKYPPERLMKETAAVNKAAHFEHYTAFRYLYANSVGLLDQENRYWIGYVAVSSRDDQGSRDVVFAWRGTVAQSEWHMDVMDKQVDYDEGLCPGVKMAEGFRTMYMRCGTGRDPPQVQVRKAMEAIYNEYGNEVGSLTVCGHSLGGALATVNSFDLVAQGLNRRPDGTQVPVTAYTFASPRVGNQAFVDQAAELGLKVLRTVNFRDVVPKVPGISKDELEGKTIEDDGSEYLGSLKAVGKITKDLWRFVISHKGDQYADIGTVLEFDTRDFPDLIKSASMGPKESASRVHNLEVLMHLIDPNRDKALLNKTQDALLDDFGIPPRWYSTPYKGMRLQSDGTWKREKPFAEPLAQ